MKVNYLIIPLLVLLPTLIKCQSVRNETVEEEEKRVNEWLKELDKDLVRRMYQDSEASWSYEANLTDTNYELMNNLSVSSAKFYKVSGRKNFHRTVFDVLH